MKQLICCGNRIKLLHSGPLLILRYELSNPSFYKLHWVLTNLGLAPEYSQASQICSKAHVCIRAGNIVVAPLRRASLSPTMDNSQPGALSWRLSSHPITLLSFLGFRLCKDLLFSDLQAISRAIAYTLASKSSCLSLRPSLHAKLVSSASMA